MKKSILKLSFFILIIITPICSGENLNKFIVAIDIGHSVENQGAMSSRGVGEYYFNRSIALALLKRINTNKNLHAFIINPEKKNIPLKKRAKIAQQFNADVLISIHHDSVQPRYLSEWTYQGKKQRYTERYHGYSLFISKKNTQTKTSLLLAESIGASLLKDKFVPSLHHAESIEGEKSKEPLNTKKGIYEYSDLLILKTPNMPTVLIECGVIINRDEEILLSDSAYQEKFVTALEKGINNYFKE